MIAGSNPAVPTDSKLESEPTGRFILSDFGDYGRSNLYKAVVAYSMNRVPLSNAELLENVASVALKVNSRTNQFLPPDFEVAAANRVADNYLEGFELFLMSVDLIDPDFDGDTVYEFYRRGGHRAGCQCILKPMFWFWNLTDKTEAFSRQRFDKLAS